MFQLRIGLARQSPAAAGQLSTARTEQSKLYGKVFPRPATHACSGTQAQGRLASLPWRRTADGGQGWARGPGVWPLSVSAHSRWLKGTEEGSEVTALQVRNILSLSTALDTAKHSEGPLQTSASAQNPAEPLTALGGQAEAPASKPLRGLAAPPSLRSSHAGLSAKQLSASGPLQVQLPSSLRDIYTLKCRHSSDAGHPPAHTSLPCFIFFFPALTII